MTDEQIMTLIKQGELDYLNLLYERWGKSIYNYFLKSTLCPADSDDLTQDLFIRLMKYRKSYKEGQKLQFWVFQIARNMVKDHFTKLKVHKEKYEQVDELPDIEEEGTDRENEKKLYLAMANLPDERRELLVLSKFQGIKYEQIAEMRNMTVANVKVQVHRTIKELRQHYFELTEEQ